MVAFIVSQAFRRHMKSESIVDNNNIKKDPTNPLPTEVILFWRLLYCIVSSDLDEMQKESTNLIIPVKMCIRE